MRLRANDRFVRRLVDDIGALIHGESALRDSVCERQLELAEKQTDSVGRYWRKSDRGIGVPTAAFRGRTFYHFPEIEPARTFRTSGTSGKTKGEAAYSPGGMALLDAAIVRQARMHLAPEPGVRFACVRLIPDSAAAADVIMAYGMQVIAAELGVCHLSDTTFDGLKLDLSRLEKLIFTATVAQVPVLLMGGTFTIVNVCDALASVGRSFELPQGSRLLDAGGLKNRARALTRAQYCRLVQATFGSIACTNLFGMTELVSQLYDAASEPTGPRGECKKGGCDWAWPTVREPESLAKVSEGIGLLEITDLAIIDRPSVVLTDDIAIADGRAATIIGRAVGAPTRGCALHIEELEGERA